MLIPKRVTEGFVLLMILISILCGYASVRAWAEWQGLSEPHLMAITLSALIGTINSSGALYLHYLYHITSLTVEKARLQGPRSTSAVIPPSDSLSKDKPFNFVVVKTSETTGQFIHANLEQIQHVARLIERGEYSLTKALLVNSGAFTRPEWESFRDEMLLHRWAIQRGDRQVELNAAGRAAIRAAAQGAR